MLLFHDKTTFIKREKVCFIVRYVFFNMWCVSDTLCRGGSLYPTLNKVQ